MNKKLGTILIVVVVVIVAAVIGWVAHKPSSSSFVGGVAGQGVPSVFDNASLTGVLQVGINPNGNVTAIPTQFATGTVYAQGDLIQGGLCSVSSSTSITLTAAQLQCTTLLVTNTASGVLTVTLPSSSSISYLANAGDETDTYIYAASTTAGNLLIAAGVGFTLNSPLTPASTTAATSTIPAGQVGSLLNVKLPTTNIIGIILP